MPTRFSGVAVALLTVTCSSRSGYEGPRQKLVPNGDPQSGDTSSAGGDTSLGDQGLGDRGASLDWRVMAAGQWPLWQAEANAVAAQGTSGAPTASLEGPSFPGSTKWTGGILGINGKIYGFPEGAARVLEIDPSGATLSAAEIGPDLGTSGFKWFSGVLAPDGRIFGIPEHDNRILLIDTNTSVATVTTYDPGLWTSTGKWTGGVRGYDGLIYGLPNRATEVLVIDPATTTPGVTTFGPVPTSTSDNSSDLYGGGAIDPASGKMYVVPCGRRYVLEIDPVAQSVIEVGPELLAGIACKFFGAALAPNGHIYGIPDAAPGFLDIDPTGAALNIQVHTTTSAVSDGGTWAPSGHIFTIPWGNGAPVLAFDPSLNTATSFTVTGAPSASSLWSDCALAPNGKIYGIPSTAEQVLVIDPATHGTLSLDALLGGFLNIY